MTDWVSILNAGTRSGVDNIHELLHFYGWIDPKDFGLPRTDNNLLEIWRFSVFNQEKVVAGDRLSNMHGMLPITVSQPNRDTLGLATRSIGEQLLPLQRFASHQINVHQRASRKKLYGVTYYNSRRISALKNQPQEDLEAARIPVDMQAMDDDIRKHIFHQNDAPETRQTMEDVENIINLMQRMLPTQIQNLVASLDRATQYQSAAVVQGSNRRNHKYAKVIDSQCMTPARDMMHSNVLEFQEAMDIIDRNTGKPVQVRPNQFRAEKIEFAISDGLKGIDRLLLIEGMKEVISMIVQSNIAVNRFDIVKIVDYWTSLLGDRADFTQFRITDILDTLEPEQREIAAALYQMFIQRQQQQQLQTAGGTETVAEFRRG